MDLMVLLQEKVRVECTWVNHWIQEYGHHVVYLSKENNLYLKYFGGFTKPYTKVGDGVQANNNGWGLCTRLVPREHGPKEKEVKWFEIEIASRKVQGMEEEVEREKG